MSNTSEDTNLYSTRASGELRERLNEYIQESDGAKSADLRHLLDLGLQADNAGIAPDDLREEVEEIREAREELGTELSEVKQDRSLYKVTADLFIASIIGSLVSNGLAGPGIPIIGGVSPIVRDALLFLAGLMLLGAMLLRASVFLHKSKKQYF